MKNKRGRPNKRNQARLIELRVRSGIFYVTATPPVSLKELNEIPPFDSVHVDTLKEWCKADSWVDRRKDHWANVATEFQKKATTTVVHEQIEKMREYSAIRDDIAQLLQDAKKRPKPNTLEGLLSAFTKMETLYHERMDFFAANVVPPVVQQMEQGADALDPRLAPEVSDAEARIMGKALLAERRRALRAQLAGEAPAVPPTPENGNGHSNVGELVDGLKAISEAVQKVETPRKKKPPLRQPVTKPGA